MSDDQPYTADDTALPAAFPAALPVALHAFWRDALPSLGADAAARFYEAFSFGDGAAMADELAALVLAGTKRATAGLLWGFEHDGEQPPRPGDLSVMTDSAGRPLAVIRTLQVDIVAFEDVDAAFAATEGEGDGSLRYWREEHWRFFTRECARIGRTPDPRMPVSCERFDVVYPPG